MRRRNAACAFSAAGGAHDGHPFPLIHVQAHVIQRFQLVIFHGGIAGAGRQGAGLFRFGGVGQQLNMQVCFGHGLCSLLGYRAIVL